jgi:putative hemolysin
MLAILKKKGIFAKMRLISSLTALCLILLLLTSSCSGQQTPEGSIPSATPGKTDANMPNPAAVFCTSKGYQLQPRTAADGSQSAACIFPDGRECDEWAYFRGECGPGTTDPNTENKAVEACKIKLAEMTGIDASKITLFSLEKITWPNSCLSIPGPNENCPAVMTPRFQGDLDRRR